MSEAINNNDFAAPTQVSDFGSILRQLRENHGMSQVRLAKRLGLPAYAISKIELCERELPPEPTLRRWLRILGCKKNLQALLVLARSFRVNQYFKINRGDRSNADIIRLLDLYRNGKLTDFDRNLLMLIGRG